MLLFVSIASVTAKEVLMYTAEAVDLLYTAGVRV